MDQMGWPPLQSLKKVQNDPSQELEIGAQYLLLFMFFGTLFLSPIQHHMFFGVETCGLVA